MYRRVWAGVGGDGGSLLAEKGGYWRSLMDVSQQLQQEVLLRPTVAPTLTSFFTLSLASPSRGWWNPPKIWPHLTWPKFSFLFIFRQWKDPNAKPNPKPLDGKQFCLLLGTVILSTYYILLSGFQKESTNEQRRNNNNNRL